MSFRGKHSKHISNHRKPATKSTTFSKRATTSWYVTKAGKIVPVELLVTVDTQWGKRAKVKFRNADTGFWVDADRVFPSKNQAQEFAESLQEESTGEGG